MNCDAASERLLDWIDGRLTESERSAVLTHLNGCPACRSELGDLQRLQQQLGEMAVPEPSPALRADFYAQLETFREEVKPRPVRRFLHTYAFRAVAACLLLSVGIGAGFWLSERSASRRQVDELSEQVRDMRQMMMLSLLENPSATERLRAVSYTRDMNEVNDKVLDALLTTLNNDPNPNVRLVTLDALVQLGSDPRVRQGLVQALGNQESPLVQVALADAMVKLQEKRSVKPLKRLLRRENLNDLVKTKIEQSIKDLS